VPQCWELPACCPLLHGLLLLVLLVLLRPGIVVLSWPLLLSKLLCAGVLLLSVLLSSQPSKHTLQGYLPVPIC
jgi:hypothetical protein